MIKDAEEMRLLAVCDINEGRLERAKREHGLENAFTDYREMIDKCDLDVVYVATQPDATADVSIYCLERGLHTSVEKPPGLTSADTRRILEAECKSDGMAIVSLNRRYIPEVLAVRKMVLDRGGPVHVAVDGIYRGHIIVSDEIKEDARQAIRELKALGVEKVAMFTGDNRAATERMAKALGLDSFLAELLPEAIDHVLARLSRNNGAVLVHCHAGNDRTGGVLTGYLSRTRGLPPGEALKAVRAANPEAISARGYEAMILSVLEREWEARKTGSAE